MLRVPCNAVHRYFHRQCLNSVYKILLAPFDGENANQNSGSIGVGEYVGGAAGSGSTFNPDAGLHAYHQHVNHFQV